MYCACPLDAPALYARRRLEDIADYTCMAKQHRTAFFPAAEELISHRDIPQPLPAGNLSRQAERLTTEVGSFIADVRAA